MHAILLCAGFGTRLYPLTRDVPKGLLEVAGRPILDYQVPQLLDLPELDTIHLVTNGHFLRGFYDWLSGWRGDFGERGIQVLVHSDGSLSDETRKGSVGDLAFVLRHIPKDVPVVITAGDNIYRFPIRPVAESFLGGEENVILALREENHQVRQRYPVIEFGEGDRVARLHGESADPPTHWVCPSLYFLRPGVLHRIPDFLTANRDAHDAFPQFIDYLAQKEPVRAVRKPGANVWLDVETRYMFRKANEILEEEPLMVEQAEGRSAKVEG